MAAEEDKPRRPCDSRKHQRLPEHRPVRNRKEGDEHKLRRACSRAGAGPRIAPILNLNCARRMPLPATPCARS